MPWIPIKGAIRRLRVARKMERSELAKRAGLDSRTIRLYESDQAPKTMQAETVKQLAAAFGCEPQKFARWEDYRTGTIVQTDTDRSDAPELPPRSTLAMRAEQQRRSGRRDWLTSPSGTHEVVGPQLLNRIKSAFGLFENQRYGITGVVEQHRAMPAICCRKLGVPEGTGTQFLLSRKVDRGVPFYASVFTRHADHTRHLLDVHDDEGRAAIVVRVVVKPRDTDWKGFFVFQKKGEKPDPISWAFIVDEVVTEEESGASGVARKSATNSPKKPDPSGDHNMRRSRGKPRAA
jgi:transcriptional regulator with XRE-family HTH domain